MICVNILILITFSYWVHQFQNLQDIDQICPSQAVMHDFYS